MRQWGIKNFMTTFSTTCIFIKSLYILNYQFGCAYELSQQLNLDSNNKQAKLIKIQIVIQS